MNQNLPEVNLSRSERRIKEPSRYSRERSYAVMLNPDMIPAIEHITSELNSDNIDEITFRLRMMVIVKEYSFEELIYALNILGLDHIASVYTKNFPDKLEDIKEVADESDESETHAIGETSIEKSEN
jgi:hypothetical protein